MERKMKALHEIFTKVKELERKIYCFARSMTTMKNMHECINA